MTAAVTRRQARARRRRRLKKLGIRLASRLAPALYLAYMRLVERTGRVVWIGRDEMLARRRAGRNIAIALLHQDIFLGPYLFRDLGIIALANVGDAGEVITALLDRCGCDPVRGGSSRSASRRTPAVGAMVARLEQRARESTAGGAMAAITPDGSRGPAGVVKPGIVYVASAAGADIFCLKIHASRAWYAPTWDRTAIPLPFATLRVELEGPVEVARDASPAQLEQVRAEVERRLRALHERAFAQARRAPVPALTSR